MIKSMFSKKVHIPKNKPFVSLIGDEKRTSDTVITWNDKAVDKDKYGNELGTYNSASVTIESDYFCATGVTFENAVVATAGDTGKQAKTQPEELPEDPFPPARRPLLNSHFSIILFSISQSRNQPEKVSKGAAFVGEGV
ncbi:hydrolase [Lithospermum erythrorhizon]|uniref:pectinesterase n=1 Tax=Lithospermum erythrorhizon TaxID=34254 RepID=A0AAV3R4S7_LITER